MGQSRAEEKGRKGGESSEGERWWGTERYKNLLLIVEWKEATPKYSLYRNTNTCGAGTPHRRVDVVINDALSD